MLADISNKPLGVGELAPSVDADELLGAVICLFARIPGLAKHLLERAERDVVGDQVAPFFDYLFVSSSSPAVGADYHVVGYRPRNANEIGLVDGAPNGDLSDFNRHETTPEMADAVFALRDAYDKYCLEQQLGDWNPNPSADRLVARFLERHRNARSSGTEIK